MLLNPNCSELVCKLDLFKVKNITDALADFRNYSGCNLYLYAKLGEKKALFIKLKPADITLIKEKSKALLSAKDSVLKGLKKRFTGKGDLVPQSIAFSKTEKDVVEMPFKEDEYGYPGFEFFKPEPKERELEEYGFPSYDFMVGDCESEDFPWFASLGRVFGSQINPHDGGSAEAFAKWCYDNGFRDIIKNPDFNYNSDTILIYGIDIPELEGRLFDEGKIPEFKNISLLNRIKESDITYFTDISCFFASVGGTLNRDITIFESSWDFLHGLTGMQPNYDAYLKNHRKYNAAYNKYAAQSSIEKPLSKEKFENMLSTTQSLAKEIENLLFYNLEFSIYYLKKEIADITYSETSTENSCSILSNCDAARDDFFVNKFTFIDSGKTNNFDINDCMQYLLEFNAVNLSDFKTDGVNLDNNLLSKWLPTAFNLSYEDYKKINENRNKFYAKYAQRPLIDTSMPAYNKKKESLQALLDFVNKMPDSKLNIQPFKKYRAGKATNFLKKLFTMDLRLDDY